MSLQKILIKVKYSIRMDYLYDHDLLKCHSFGGIDFQWRDRNLSFH